MQNAGHCGASLSEYMQVLNVHGAVACACHQNVESIAQLKDTDHTRSYDTKNILVHALHSVEAVWQVGPGAGGLLLPPRMTSSFSADARSVMTGHSEFSVTVCRPVNFPSGDTEAV